MTHLCTVCEQEINHGESHIGPPFEDKVRHMKCPAKCEKCGKRFWNLGRHVTECGGRE